MYLIFTADRPSVKIIKLHTAKISGYTVFLVHRVIKEIMMLLPQKIR